MAIRRGSGISVLGLVTLVFYAPSHALAQEGSAAAVLMAFSSGCSVTGGVAAREMAVSQQLTELFSSLDRLDNPDDQPGSACQASLTGLRSVFNTRITSDSSDPEVAMPTTDSAAQIYTPVLIGQLETTLAEAERIHLAEMAKPVCPGSETMSPPYPPTAPYVTAPIMVPVLDTFPGDCRTPVTSANATNQLTTTRQELARARSRRDQAQYEGIANATVRTASLAQSLAQSIQACSNDARILPRLLGPALGIAGATGSLGGPLAGALISAGADIIGAIVSLFNFRDDRARQALATLDEARFPVAAFCAMENLGSRYCRLRSLRGHLDAVDSYRSRPRPGALSGRVGDRCEAFSAEAGFSSLLALQGSLDPIMTRMSPSPSALSDTELVRLGRALRQIRDHAAYVASEIREYGEALRIGAPSRAEWLERWEQADRFVQSLEPALQTFNQYESSLSGGFSRDARASTAGGRAAFLGSLSSSGLVLAAEGGSSPSLRLREEMRRVLESQRSLVRATTSSPDAVSASLGITTSPRLDLLEDFSLAAASGINYAAGSDTAAQLGGGIDFALSNFRAMAGYFQPRTLEAIQQARRHLDETRTGSRSCPGGISTAAAACRDDARARSAGAVQRLIGICSASLGMSWEPGQVEELTRQCQNDGSPLRIRRGDGREESFSTLIRRSSTERECILAREGEASPLTFPALVPAAGEAEGSAEDE